MLSVSYHSAVILLLWEGMSGDNEAILIDNTILLIVHWFDSLKNRLTSGASVSSDLIPLANDTKEKRHVGHWRHRVTKQQMALIAFQPPPPGRLPSSLLPPSPHFPLIPPFPLALVPPTHCALVPLCSGMSSSTQKQVAWPHKEPSHGQRTSPHQATTRTLSQQSLHHTVCHSPCPSMTLIQHGRRVAIRSMQDDEAFVYKSAYE